jgi:Mor family transcriptional regulator
MTLAQLERLTQNDMKPLERQLDPAFPDRLREMAEHLYAQLITEPVTAKLPRDELAAVALRQTITVSSEMGGGTFYMHKGLSFHLSLRNRQMCAEFKGHNLPELAKRYDLTEVQVRNIIRQYQRERFLARQGSLLPADEKPPA